MEKKDIYEQFAEKAMTYLQSTEAFLKEQLPDFFQQVVTYHIVSAVVWMIVSGIVLFFSFRLLLKAISNKDNYGDIKDSSIPVVCISSFLIVICSIGLACNIEQGMKAYFAPKVFIIDYLRGR